MPQSEADYEIDFSEDEDRILAEARADAQAAAEEARRAAEAEANKTDRELAVIQARGAVADGSELTVVEGSAVVDDGNSIEFMGKRFRIAEKIGLMPLLKFASAADSGLDTEDQRGLAAMYAMLRDCIYAGTPACGECPDCKAGRDTQCKAYEKGDWGAFEDHAIETKADGDELFPVINQVIEIISGRPTQPQGGSSATQRGTRRGSTGSTSGGRGRASKR